MDLPLEIERKYIIEYPDEALLREHATRRIGITQTYLRGTQDGASRRIRRSEEDHTVTYTTTEKTRIDMLQRVEIEREISETEYLELKMERDPDRKDIVKTRWCVPTGELTAEIDVFEGFKQYAFCEIELPSPDTACTVPPFLNVIREATEDRRFTNASLSLNGFPPLAD